MTVPQPHSHRQQIRARVERRVWAHRGRTRGVAVALLSAVVLASCGGTDVSVDSTDSSSSSISTTPAAAPTLAVAVAFYPIEDVLSRVGGDRIEIVRLVAPGDNAHEAELTAKTVEALGESDVVFYMSGGFQPTVEKAIAALPASVKAVDLFESEGVEHIDAHDTHSEGTDDHAHSDGDSDPHIWLDPTNMAAMARAAAATLTDLDPDGASVYAANAASYAEDMAGLGTEITARLAMCATRTLVTAHDAFGYLARRAGLETVSVAGLNPEDEPSARQLETIAEAARTAGVNTVFFEVSLPENLARTVARAIGANVDTLDALEGVTQETLSAGGTYSSIMRGNIDRIAAALGCS